MAASTGRSIRVVRLIALSAAIGIVAGCGGSATVPSAAPTAGGVDTPRPSPTPWPSLVIDGVIALGLADAELWKAGADIAKAADANDVKAMWGAADGTVRLIDELLPTVEDLAVYPHTAELAAAYRASLPVMSEGATQIRDSITAGDPDGIIAGSQRLAEGVTLYGDVRSMLEPFVKEALTMKDSLVK